MNIPDESVLWKVDNCAKEKTAGKTAVCNCAKGWYNEEKGKGEVRSHDG